MQLFDCDESLATEVSRVLCVAIDQGHGAISIATPEHQRIIGEHLVRRGIDVHAVLASGQYHQIDAVQLLPQLCVDGWPDVRRFSDALQENVLPMCSRFTRVSVFGEMVAILWAKGQHDAAIRLEQLWNEFVNTQPVVLHCAYPKAAATDSARADAFRRVCLEHCKALGSDALHLSTAPP
jgi:hypothetical protein